MNAENDTIERLLLRPLVRESLVLLGFLVALCGVLVLLGIARMSIGLTGLAAILVSLCYGESKRKIAKFRRFFTEPQSVFWIQIPGEGERGREVLLFSGVLLHLRNRRELAFHPVSGEPAIRTFVPENRFDETMSFLRKLNSAALDFRPAGEAGSASGEPAPEPAAENAEN